MTNNSNKRLNEHKTRTNRLISAKASALKEIKRINPDLLQIDNIEEIYRDKVYEITRKLEKKNIDFWSDDFILRNAIMADLQGRMLSNNIYLSLLVDKLEKAPTFMLTSRALNTITIAKEMDKINKINEIADSVRNYDIEEELETILMRYFSCMPEKIIFPGDAITTYLDIKENILEMNAQERLKPFEASLLKIIEEKEEAASKNFENLKELLSNITDDEEKEIEKPKKRTRTRK